MSAPSCQAVMECSPLGRILDHVEDSRVAPNQQPRKHHFVSVRLAKMKSDKTQCSQSRREVGTAVGHGRVNPWGNLGTPS